MGFHPAHKEPGAGLREISLPDGKLYMQEVPVLTRADLTDAAALVDRQGQNFVGLRFSEAGARKLNDVSSKNVGNMLALVIDRELVAAPLIGEPLNRGVLAFGVPSAQAASEIAAKIRGDAAVTPAGAAPQPSPERSARSRKPAMPGFHCARNSAGRLAAARLGAAADAQGLFDIGCRHCFQPDALIGRQRVELGG